MFIGHEQLVEDFKKLAERNELSHGYLFFGPPRVGKRMFAVRLANLLETGVFDPSSLISDGEIREGRPNILSDELLIEPDENQATRGERLVPSKVEGSRTTRGEHSRTIGIDQIRGLKNFLWQKPIFSTRRTAIVNDAESLTDEAQNALLKIAEEPPASSLLVLVAADSEKLRPTLSSRLQKIYFSPIPSSQIEQWLTEKIAATKEEARFLAESSFGQPGLAWRMAKDEKFRSLRQSADALLRSGFWERRTMIKALLEKDDFNLTGFLEVLLMHIAEIVRAEGKHFARWHKIIELRRQADYFNLNPRLQLENLLNANE